MFLFTRFRRNALLWHAFVPLRVFWVLGAICTSAVCQPAKTPDEQWLALKTFGHPQQTHAGKANSTRPSPASEAARLIAEANQLEAFYTRYPQHTSAAEAKRLACLALCHAAIAGDRSNEQRRADLIAQLRDDTAIEPIKRFEAVAWSRQVPLARGGMGDRPRFFAAQESVARALIAEFPTVSDGYESLVAIARDGPAARAVSIAQDAIGMASCPPRVREEACRLIKQHNLIGKTLDALLHDAGLPSDSPGAEAAPRVIYSWSGAYPRGIALVQRLKAAAPQARFVGVCLDPDSSEARKAAVTAALPGEQFYDERGGEGKLPQMLGYSRGTAVYLTNRAGVIVDVNAHVDLTLKIEQFAR